MTASWRFGSRWSSSSPQRSRRAAPRARASPATGPTATAKALAVRIVFPDGRVVGSPSPRRGRALGDRGELLPTRAIGSVVVTGAIEAATATKEAEDGRARAPRAAASNVSLFEGEITADSVASAHATAVTNARQRRAVRSRDTSVVQPAGSRPRPCLREGDARRLGDARHLAARCRPERGRRDEGLRRATSIAVDVKLDGGARRAAGRHRDPGRVRRRPAPRPRRRVVARERADGRRPAAAPAAVDGPADRRAAGDRRRS